MKSLVFKLGLLFFAAHVFHSGTHESVHALTAYALHIRSTLHHLYVNPDTAHASAQQAILIAVAGPIWSLLLGAASWLVYRTTKRGTLKIFMLYSTTFGISIFLGNVFSTAFAGDFHTAALAANAGAPLRVAASVIGFIVLVVFMYQIGPHFMKFGDNLDVSPFHRTVLTLVVPNLLGGILTVLALLPLPFSLATGTLGELVFWIPAVIGGYQYAGRHANSGNEQISTTRLTYIDGLLALVALGVVRLMMQGIDFVP